MSHQIILDDVLTKFKDVFIKDINNHYQRMDNDLRIKRDTLVQIDKMIADISYKLKDTISVVNDLLPTTSSEEDHLSISTTTDMTSSYESFVDQYSTVIHSAPMVQPSPGQPSPVQPSPVQPSPVQTSPVDKSSTTTSSSSGSVPKNTKYCSVCDVNISRSSWSRHEKTTTHKANKNKQKIAIVNS